MKVVFFGTPAWAVPSLDSLSRSAHPLVAVVSQPDRRSARRGGAAPPPVARKARELGIPLAQPETVRSAEFADWLRALAPEACVLVAYGEILPRALLEVPRRGFINVHFSLLPKYRGAAPVQRAIEAAERVTGVTTMAVAPRLDAGDIYLQEAVAIGEDEAAPSLGSRLALLGATLLTRTLDGVEDGTLRARPQDEAEATRAPAIAKEEGRVDWSAGAGLIARRIRAFDPWPGCTTHLGGRLLRLVSASEAPSPPAPPGAGSSAGGPLWEPGRVLSLDGEALCVACGGPSVLRVGRLQFEGRRAVTGREAVNGRLVSVGDRLGETTL